MKFKIFYILFFIFAVSVSAVGCGKEKTDMTTISIAKDGTVTHTIVEPFGEEYNIEELKMMLQNSVSDYQKQTGGGSIEIVDVKNVDEGAAKVVMKYPDIASLKGFYDLDAVEPATCFYGTVEEARAEGFDMDLFLMKKGKPEKTISAEEILKMGDNRAFIYDNGMNMNLKTRVVFPTGILYYSDYVNITGNKTAEFTGEMGDLSFVLLK